MFYAVHYEAHWTLQDQYYQLQSLVPLVDNPNHRFDSGQGEGLESDMFDLLEQQITQPDEIRGPVQTFHRHTLPWETHSEKSSGTSIPSMVGTKGMPLPAPRPRGPKLKFTPEDDKLVIDLKESKDLTWKQIAEFFPGRSAGTLQVRYCTKLKARTTQWTDRAVGYTYYFRFHANIQLDSKSSSGFA
jgi:hypothetical protein